MAKKIKVEIPISRLNSRRGVTRLMLRLFPGPSDGLEQICFCDLFPTREVPCGNLRVNLYARIRGNQMICSSAECLWGSSAFISDANKKNMFVPGRSYRVKMGMPFLTMASYFLVTTIHSKLGIAK